MRKKFRPTITSTPSSLNLLNRRRSHPMTRRRTRLGANSPINVYWLITQSPSRTHVPTSDRKE